MTGHADIYSNYPVNNKMKSVSFFVFIWLLFGLFPGCAYSRAPDYESRLNACFERLGNGVQNVLEILDSEGAPRDMIYLACAESTGDANAVSKQGAAGLWQLMPGTARRFGLIVNADHDQRFDVELSTRAAARYIKSLLAMFHGDFLWAVAAYNAGGHNLTRATHGHARGMRIGIIRDIYPHAYALAVTVQRMRENQQNY